MDAEWRRIDTRAEFIDIFADKVLFGDNLRFTIHSSGDITGQAGGQDFFGSWYWEDGFFCRAVSSGEENHGLDCEVTEYRGLHMRYTRQMGQGYSSVVTIEQV
ncbi:hypothetical protein SAMN05444358_11310 [Ruegeria halocynthiae]|uniref:Uncharacterized protein n=1 Tax=Ruegeria halocynthiae TaxID=985054 RepID=A0A1H3F1K3_9RHOB|nr:hypothetical protein [Ruegeria halocynthiae]SDX84913.1 hypothetical protein SAMN05444358_11310 [Ruegeria halocynthiae]